MLSDRSKGRIYVETFVRGELGPLWERSQEPAQHQRWDLRFTTIEPTGPGRFRYAVGPVEGVGTRGGEHRGAEGSATSVLRFASAHPLSLLREGSGFWRYVPARDGHGAAGVRFLTGYDYAVRWGRAGRLTDRAFRPLIGWGTAWSFDRLRLWLEHDLTPERALRIAALDLATRIAVVVATALRSRRAAMVVGVIAARLPPSPRTPAARRCLRRPPDPRSATAPGSLARLERPR